jgi:predicted RNase H-like HicB family nuclease
MSKYIVFFEETATGYSAHVPDLPGCIGAAGTLEETKRLMREAIEFHIEGMLLHAEPVPEPTTIIDVVDVNVAEIQESIAR